MLMMFGADANFGFTLLSSLRNIAFSLFPYFVFFLSSLGVLSLFFFWGWGGRNLVDLHLDLLIFAKSFNGKKRVSMYFY